MCRQRSMKLVLGLVAGLTLVCLLVLVISSILNSRLPKESDTIPQLSEADKGRLREYLHLKQDLGDEAWPGFGAADIPVILYNEEYAFLVGLPEPPAGWLNVTTQRIRGTDWEPVHDDTFDGQIYFRQQLPSGLTPQAFAVQVGNHWAASMTTMQWARIALAAMLEEELPSAVRPVFPYWLMVQGLMEGSDHHIAAVAHEAFHAFEGIRNEAKLLDAEAVASQAENYPYFVTGFEEAWQTELDLLAQALQTGSDDERANYARQFLETRQQRRQEFGITNQLLHYERAREWEEGLAKYIELTLWRLGAESADYQPLLVDDPEFDAYAGYERRWDKEVDQLQRMAADGGDGRFYYSGMAQAVLLDHLFPDWKEQALDDDVYLEDLLVMALEGQDK